MVKGEIHNYSATLAEANICSGDVVQVCSAQRAGGRGVRPPETLDIVVKIGVPVATFVGAIAAWLTAQQGRRAKFKKGDLEIETAIVEELEKVLAVAKKHLPEPAVPSNEEQRPQRAKKEFYDN